MCTVPCSTNIFEHVQSTPHKTFGKIQQDETEETENLYF